MKKSNAYKILTTLKMRLDKNGQIIVQEDEGAYSTRKFTFNEPASTIEIDSFIGNDNLSFPKQYIEFLELHNGADFFQTIGKYNDPEFYLYKLDEIVENSEDICPSKNFYCIGTYDSEFGSIIIDGKRVKEGRDDYMFIMGDETIELNCDFTTWLDRAIMTNGSPYWEWAGNYITDDKIENDHEEDDYDDIGSYDGEYSNTITNSSHDDDEED